MATTDWIKETVETQGRPCPYRMHLPGKQRLCPGTREGCAFWVTEVLSRDDAPRDSYVQAGCLVAFNFVLAHEEVLETKRGIEATNQTAATQAAGIAAALSRPAETRIVVMPVDAGHVEKLVALMNGGQAALPDQGTAPALAAAVAGVPSGDG